MGKARKKNLSEKVRTKKREPNQKINPFEVKINRQKHDVIGRKISKHDKGMPGLSRSKAMKKRKETLLVEFRQRGKVNRVTDRRLGEGDPSLDPEEKMIKRFAAERQKHHTRGDLYNLNEDEDLTHYGQSLSEIEKFNDPVDSDSGDEGDGGQLGADLVGEQHFGGFFTQKEGDETETKSWKDRMEEIIAKSKKEKYERQSEREKLRELTDKADAEWKELHLLMGGIKSKNKDQEDKEATPFKSKLDDYDITVRELKFEIRGQPTDRLKTEEELAAEEKERLEKLEADRTRRMKGLVDDNNADSPSQSQPQAHRSADDLDDDYFELGKPDKKVRFHLSYKDGQMLTEEGEEEKIPEENTAEEDEGEEGAESEEEESDDDKSDSESEGSEEDGMERTSDLESSEDEEEEEDADEVKDTPKSEVSKGILKRKPTHIQTPEEIQKQLKERKKIMEQARTELPYTFKAPESVTELQGLMEEHNLEERLTIIERIRKCHHPSLAEGNKAKLEKLFALLVEYYGELALEDPPNLMFMNRLTHHLYELCQMAPLPGGQAVLALINQQQKTFTEYSQDRNGRGLFPGLDVLLTLKLVSLLFPTSDLRHAVVTPTMLFMSQILTQCPVNTRRDVGAGLFTCNLFLEFVSFSKRFVPEAINFLCGVLFLAGKKDPKKIEPVIPPFKPVGRNIHMLELQTQEASSIQVAPLKISDVFSRSKSKYLSTESFRVCAIAMALKLLHKFAVLYESLPAYSEVASPVQHFVKLLPIEKYPEEVQKCSKNLLDQLTKAPSGGRCYLTMQAKKPQALKLYEPKFEEKFYDKKKHSGSEAIQEKQRMLHKYRREKKGALREVRRDNQFLAKQKLDDRMQRDSERKRKVKEIYQQLATQEGDYKALKRMKDRL